MSEASEVVTRLRELGWMLGVAESLTGGLLSAAIVDVPGASSVFRGGVVAYATPLKATLLGVDSELLETHGPVHPDVARQMAHGVRTACSIDGVPAHVGIATTGIAGPDSPDGQPVGTVHIGIVTPGGARVVSVLLRGTRAEIRETASQIAIRTLARTLAEQAPGNSG